MHIQKAERKAYSKNHTFPHSIIVQLCEVPYFRNKLEDTWKQLPYKFYKGVCSSQEHEFLKRHSNTETNMGSR